MCGGVCWGAVGSLAVSVWRCVLGSSRFSSSERVEVCVGEQ